MLGCPRKYSGRRNAGSNVREASDFFYARKLNSSFISYDCNGTGAQNWIVNRERTEVQLAGTKFCLDAGPVSGEFSWD